jgi:hypothetical protein
MDASGAAEGRRKRMGYRVFRDSQGTEWQTWDVVPHLTERRATDRRRAAVAAAMPAVERRATPDRRMGAGRRPLLSAGLDAGWLCFEAPSEKRRLTPIPADWLRCDEACLEHYCRQARPAMRASAAIDISRLTDFRN